jgi:hypothetical protein
MDDIIERSILQPLNEIHNREDSDMGMTMVTLQQLDGSAPATLTMDAAKCYRFQQAVNRLDRNAVYQYEEGSGSKVLVRFIGFLGLNAAFLRVNKNNEALSTEEYLAPSVDMGDGSLFTEWLERL